MKSVLLANFNVDFRSISLGPIKWFR